MGERIKILVVDDEAYLCEIMQSHLQRKGYAVFVAINARAAISVLKEQLPHVILIDKLMPGTSGVELLAQIRAFDKEVKVIMISAEELDGETARAIKELDVFCYLRKSAVIDCLDETVAKAAELSPVDHTQMPWQANG